VTPLLVAAGALVGAPLRLLADRLARGTVYGILAVNVLGSAVLGLVLGVAAPPAVTALVGTGFCGTLTTFSTFSADVVRLASARELGRAAAYLLLTLVLGLAAAALAYAAGRAL
jgi:CrcB protein